MQNLNPSDLKTILHSKRANLYYLEHCRVLLNGGRVEYVTEEGKKSLYWNIPIANTSSILLGTGTSISQAAMRELAKAGVLVGFCGGGGTPLYAANEVEINVSWITPQSEYRPTEYLQNWLKIWQDDNKRLKAAMHFQKIRLNQIKKCWLAPNLKRTDRYIINEENLLSLLDRFLHSVDNCKSNNDILIQEAVLTKALYKISASAVNYGDFNRSKRGEGTDIANRYLDYGNYLTYGLGATAAWVMGLPHGLSILHGKTRRGGLVFDIADLIKDALILPNAFISAMAGEEDQEFRLRCLETFNKAEALDLMIDSIKETIDIFDLS
jgi:CRISPR-associated protein Cas1